jgi:hypothetical protein
MQLFGLLAAVLAFHGVDDFHGMDDYSPKAMCLKSCQQGAPSHEQDEFMKEQLSKMCEQMCSGLEREDSEN